MDFVSSESGVPSAATARETSTQCMPGPATSSDGSTKSPSTSSLRAILNSGSAIPERPGAVSTMFIVSRPQPSATKYSSATAITSAAVRPGS